MRKLKFKPEDFDAKDLPFGNDLASLANEMFEKWYREEIENAPIVYSEPGYVDGVPVNFTRRCIPKDYRFTAKLVCIEEIKNEN